MSHTPEPIPGDGAAEAPDASVEQLRERLAALQQGHATYRQRVRDRAIEGFREHQWNLQQLNDTLDRLGLARYEPQVRSRCRVAVEFDVASDHRDRDRAAAAIRQIEHDTTRQALRQAVATVLTEHASDELPLTLDDAFFTIRTGRVHQQEW